jgi:exopolysaccharide production protein ExoZ
MSNGRVIASVQWLRGIAAVMVVLAHLDLGTDTFYLPLLLIQGYGGGGVDIFFAISGFIMMVTTGEGAFSQRDFLARRLIRVAPTYWIYTSIFFLTALFSRFHPSFIDLIRSILFVPYSHFGTYTPIVNVGWTLNYEMFFYLVFSFVRRSPRMTGVRTFFIFASLVALGAALPRTGSVFAFYGSPIILEFAFGCLIGQLWLSPVRVPPALAVIAGIAGLVGFVLLPTFTGLVTEGTTRAGYRVLALGIPAALILFGAVFCARDASFWKNRAMLLLGQISFSIYLTHTFVIRVLYKLFQHSALSAGATVAVTALCVGIVIVSAWLAYAVIERPITGLLLRMTGLGGGGGATSRSERPVALQTGSGDTVKA